MGVGRAAATALRWIGKAIGWYRTNRTVMRLIGDLLPIDGEKYLKELEKLEKSWGADTRVFPRLETAYRRVKAGDDSTTLTLDAAEIRYFYFFKKLWDKYIKKVLRKLR